MLTIFHGYSNEQLLLFQELYLYCHLFLISIQTKLSANIRQRCYKHIQWQREKLNNNNNNDEYRNFDEKFLHTNLISYAQQYISKHVLSNKTDLFKANDPIRMVSVKFLEPESNIEQVLEFLPGLSVSIPCLMNAKNLDQNQTINIKVLIVFIFQ